jgi:hypothetical protein
MPRDGGSFWYALGQTVEAATSFFSAPARGPRPSKRPRPAEREPSPDGSALTPVLSAVVSALAAAGAARLTSAGRPTVGRLLRGAAAGAGAAGILYSARVFLERDGAASDSAARELADELLAGAGKGVLYATLLDPYLPGPPLVRGAVAGSVDYLTLPFGGLFSKLQSLSPVRRIPVLSILLETGDAEDDPFLIFRLHGAILGVLYGEPGDDD